MSKKHFIALADALREARPIMHEDTDYFKGWRKAVLAVADVCAAENPRFSRERWLGYIAGTNGPSGGAR